MSVQMMIGISAIVFTAISPIPQLAKIIREKKHEGISIIMLGVLVLGLALWTWYGFLKNDWLIVISNGFSFLANAVVLALAIIYRKSGSA